MYRLINRPTAPDFHSTLIRQVNNYYVSCLFLVVPFLTRSERRFERLQPNFSRCSRRTRQWD